MHDKHNYIEEYVDPNPEVDECYEVEFVGVSHSAAMKYATRGRAIKHPHSGWWRADIQTAFAFRSELDKERRDYIVSIRYNFIKHL